MNFIPSKNIMTSFQTLESTSFLALISSNYLFLTSSTLEISFTFVFLKDGRSFSKKDKDITFSFLDLGYFFNGEEIGEDEEYEVAEQDGIVSPEMRMVIVE